MKKMALVLLCSILCSTSVIGQEITPKKVKNIFHRETSSKMEKQCLDQIISLITETTHSQQGRIRADVSEKLDSIVYEEDEKYVYTYYDNGLTKTRTIYYWDWQTDEWIQDEKYEYEYNPNGDLSIETLYIEYYPSPDLTTRKTEYTYNASGELTEKLISVSEGEDSDFLISEKIVSLYENGIKTADTNYSFYGNVWYPEGVITYAYDDNHNLILIKNYTAEGGEWMEISHIEINYDNSMPILFKLYGCDEDGCFEYIKFEFAYDANNVLTTITNYEMDDFENEEGEWYPEVRYGFVYNLDIPVSSLVVPYWYTFEYKIEKVQLSYFYENGWEVEDEMIFHYSGFDPISITHNVIRDLKVYPNPVTSNVMISTSENYSSMTFELYSIDGKKLMERNVNSHESVSVEGLSSGLYIYNITADGKKQTGKIVKQ